MSDEWKEVANNAKDVQYERPESRLKIKNVGIDGFKFPLTKFSNDRIKYSAAMVRATVDVPMQMRGANMSRTAIGITESLPDVKRIEELAGVIAERILSVHEYSLKSRVNLKGEGFLYTESPVSYLDSIEHFQFNEQAIKIRDKVENNILGIKVTGISTCPCGSELMRTKLKSKIEEIQPTHMQRATVSILVNFYGKAIIEMEDLLDAAYKSMSGRVYSTLKRADEAFVIYSSLQNTKFVEDIYRSAVNETYIKLANYNGIKAVYARAESFESIHGYNAVASGWLDWESIRETIKLP